MSSSSTAAETAPMTMSHPRAEERLLHLGAGPSAFPIEVLERARAELITLPGAGMSPLELSHRSAPFEELLLRAQRAFAALYGLKAYGGGGEEEHELLLLQGGASLQFSMIPLHYGAGGAYINTGTWSTRALKEARVAWGEEGASEPWSSESGGFCRVPVTEQITLKGDEPYLHYTSNNTIYGTQLRAHPELSCEGVPLVIDASSDLISRPLDLSRCDLVYGGAQKNAGPAGVTVVMGRPELLRRAPVERRCPTTLRYQTHAKSNSLYHTPPTFGVYLVALVAEWALAQGGLEALNARAEQRAGEVYALLDRYPSLYQGHASPESRSLMNVTFRLPSPELEERFLREASALRLTGLKGHRSVGGVRASLYNAVTDEAVETLVRHLERFAQAGS